jgi:hypothetical protein
VYACTYPRCGRPARLVAAYSSDLPRARRWVCHPETWVA